MYSQLVTWNKSSSVCSSPASAKVCSWVIKSYANNLLTGWLFLTWSHICVFFSCLLHSGSLHFHFFKKQMKFPILHCFIHLGSKIQPLCCQDLCSLMLIRQLSALVQTFHFNVIQCFGWMKQLAQLLSLVRLGCTCRQRSFFHKVWPGKNILFIFFYWFQIEQKSISALVSKTSVLMGKEQEEGGQ